MKNSPDPEWFQKVEKRLGDYSEEPDAYVRDKIAGMLGKQRDPFWMPWAHRSATLVYVLILLWAGIDWINADVSVNGRTADIERRSAVDDSSRNLQQDPGGGVSLAHPSGTNDHSAKASKIHKGDHYSESVSGNTAERVVLLSTLKPVDLVVLTQESGSGVVAEKESITTDSINSETKEVQLSSSDKKGVVLPGKRKRHFIFYGSIAPSLSFQKISPFANDGVVIDALYIRPVFSEDRLGFSFQAGIQSKISRRLEFYGGLSFYHQSQNMIYHYVSGSEVHVRPEKDFDYTVTPGTMEVRARYDMFNVGTQAGLLYYLSGERLAHKIGAGISWYHGTKKMSAGERYNNAKSQYLYYELFYRNEFAVSSSFNFFVQPFYKHILISLETFEVPFTVKPYEGGVRVGVLYHLR